MKPSTRDILDFVHGLSRFQDTETLSRYICENLPALIGCENAAVCRHDGPRRLLTGMEAQHMLSCAPHVPHINASGITATHPFWNTVFDPNRPVQHIRDVVSRRDWLNNPFYNEVFAPDGIEGQIKMEVFGTPDQFITVNILRSSATYSPNDSELLTVLHPHIAQAYLNAHLLEYAGLVLPTAYTRRPAACLSRREAEIIDWVAKGKSNEQIAEILNVALSTVKTHLRRSFIKLGVENRTAAVTTWKMRPLPLPPCPPKG